MTTFALIHGGGGSAHDWHLVEAELRARGHRTVAVDLPTADPEAGLWDYADTVVEAVGEHDGLVVAGMSWGGFIAPLAAQRAHADAIVMITAMIPKPGETPADWWENSGRPPSQSDDPYEIYLHDVPRDVAEAAVAHNNPGIERMRMDKVVAEPWPLPAWPDIPTRYLLCRDDRFFTADFVRRHVAERLGIVPDEMPGGHFVALSRPKELAEYLVTILT